MDSDNNIQEAPQLDPTSIQPTPMPTDSGSGKSKWLWIIIAILLLFGLSWLVYSAVFKNKNITPSDNIPSNDQTGNQIGSQAKNGSSNNCDRETPNQAGLNLLFGNAGINETGIKWTVTNQYPKEFPSNFPKYDNAKVLVYTLIEIPAKDDQPASTALLTQTCSTDGVAKIKDYFKSITLAKTGWQSQNEALLQSNSNTPPAMFEQIQQQLESQPLKVFAEGGFGDTSTDPKKEVTVYISETAPVRINYLTWY